MSEASESEPSMKCRYRLNDVRTGGWHCLRDQLGGRPDVCPSGIRHVGGAKLNQALVRNVRTCAPMANLFLHYAFDMWMARTFPHIPFERYADDAICHCKNAEEAQGLWSALADRFAACKLVLHPEKTKIVYCKDVSRRGDYRNQSFDFLGYTFRARKTMWRGQIQTHRFMPAASPKALKSISRTIRRWRLHHHSDKALHDLADKYNPYIRGWINYFGHFCREQLRATLLHIDAYLIRWARRKFKRLRGRPKGARDWLARIRRASPTLFPHWRFFNVGGRTSEAV